MKRLKEILEFQILKNIADVQVNAVETERLSNTSNLIIHGVDGETLLMSLDLKGFAVSTGAACSSGNPEPSPVLLAMGLSRTQAQTSLRVSFGWGNTIEEVEAFLDALESVILRLRGLREQRLVGPHV